MAPAEWALARRLLQPRSFLLRVAAAHMHAALWGRAYSSRSCAKELQVSWRSLLCFDESCGRQRSPKCIAWRVSTIGTAACRQHQVNHSPKCISTIVHRGLAVVPACPQRCPFQWRDAVEGAWRHGHLCVWLCKVCKACAPGRPGLRWARPGCSKRLRAAADGIVGGSGLLAYRQCTRACSVADQHASQPSGVVPLLTCKGYM
jgi:hypothetical protein